MSDKVLDFAPSPERSASSSAGGGGGDFGERLARLETKTDNIDWKINNHLATKEGMKHLEVLIVEKEATLKEGMKNLEVLIEKKGGTLVKWIAGLLITVVVGLSVALIKIFGAPG